MISKRKMNAAQQYYEKECAKAYWRKEAIDADKYARWARNDGETVDAEAWEEEAADCRLKEHNGTPIGK